MQRRGVTAVPVPLAGLIVPRHIPGATLSSVSRARQSSCGPWGASPLGCGESWDLSLLNSPPTNESSSVMPFKRARPSSIARASDLGPRILDRGEVPTVGWPVPIFNTTDCSTYFICGVRLAKRAQDSAESRRHTQNNLVSLSGFWFWHLASAFWGCTVHNENTKAS